jgi:hypothetical protein
VTTLHVSQVRRKNLIVYFERKVSTLEEIVKNQRWTFGPDQPSLIEFCRWTSPDEPHLRRISHSAIYKDVDEFNRLRSRAADLLKILRRGRGGARPSGRKTLVAFAAELEVEKGVSQSYLDLITMLRAELETTRKDLDDVKRRPASFENGRVVQLRKSRRQFPKDDRK